MVQLIHTSAGRRHVALITLLLLLTSGSLAAQARRMTISEMTAAAGTIIVGTVTHARSALDERGDPVTYTTFRVEQAIKGTPGGTFTIKQYGGVTSTANMLINHMRYFRQGERVMVMLYPPSRLGFSSPVGLDQGAWSVDRGMVQRVSNEALSGMNTTLKRYGLSPRSSQSVPTTTFVSIIRDVMAQRRDAR